MGKNIIIAGAGHGGLTAAYHLAKSGYTVTVYERAAQESDLGYEWEDFFDARTFDEAGLPNPETGKIPKVPISFYGPNPDDPPIRQTFADGEVEMHMYRKELYAHLIRVVSEAGVKIVFGCTVYAPILIGSRIVGIQTSLGDFTGDLVIDACGVDSPLRTNLPAYLGIQKTLKKYEYLYAYRAYFNRLEGFDDVQNEYKTYFVDDGKDGLCWAVTTEKTVDLLVARFEPFGQDEIDRMFKIFKADNPHLGEELVLGGQVTKIPLRHPLAVLVADGYAAIGDSACMTVPIAGSGIANSLRAGKLLADAILSDINEEYSATTLWKYQKAFYDKIGDSMATIDMARMFLLNMKKADFEFFFGNDILSSEDLSFNTNETSAKEMFSHFSPSVIIDKLKKVGGNRSLIRRLGVVAVRIGRLKLITSRMPETYSREAVSKWAEKYERLFAETQIK
ncbi:MAG: NAD(P)/FAD-dependent oxidoreductase [Clostridia bacterium]|nr:NAD(P)/FAD-dependent oxidoreductase [Clostridia bacterium]